MMELPARCPECNSHNVRHVTPDFWDCGSCGYRGRRGFTLTITGRDAANEPNIQNIPIRTEEGRLIRSAFLRKRTA